MAGKNMSNKAYEKEQGRIMARQALREGWDLTPTQKKNFEKLLASEKKPKAAPKKTTKK